MKRYLPRALVAATVMIALFCALPTSPASAAGPVVPADITTVYQSFFGNPTPSNPGVPVGGVVSCPAGSLVVGSGAGNGNVSSLAPVQNYTAVRMAGAVSWPSPTYGGNFIQVEALCAPANELTDVQRVQVRDHRARRQHGPNGQYLQDVASCPRGFYAFGGGGYLSTSDDETGFEGAIWVTGNGPTPDGNGWAFTAQAQSDSQTMVVEAQCARRTGRESLAQTGSPVVQNPHPGSDFYDFRAAYAHCPSGSTPISGGWFLATASGQQAFPTGAQNYIGSSLWSVGGPQTSDSGALAWYASATARDGEKLITLAQCLRP